MHSIKSLISFLLLLSVGLCISCSEQMKREYYDNGFIKKEDYFIDKKLDSSVHFHESKKDQIKEIRSFTDSTIHISRFDVNGKLTMQGRTLRNNTDFKIGKWVYSDFNSKMDSIVEYVNYNNKPYVNQFWLRTFNRDTIIGRGNYFDVYTEADLISKFVKVRFILFEPALGEDSDIMVIIPKDDKELNSDFSNLFEIESDTLKSYENDGIERTGLPDGLQINHISDFGINYEESGRHKIRGVLIEFKDKKQKDGRVNESNEKLERRMFFDVTVNPKAAPGAIKT